MVLPTTHLDDIWEEGKGSFDFGEIKIDYDVRPNISKEEWKREFERKVYGRDTHFWTDKSGRIYMPQCGIV